MDGKRLEEVDPALFAETQQALRLRDVSPAGASLDEDEAAFLAEKLREARVSEKCGCGQPDCNTYYFHTPAKPEGSVRLSTVRFFARGEHLLHIDSDGDIYKLQRLYEAGGPRTIFARAADGSWEARSLGTLS